MKNIWASIKRKAMGIGLAGQDVAVNPNCSELEINNWVISEFIVRKLLPLIGIHPYPVNEQCLMVAAVCALKPAVIFEWGTNLGKSARIFYETTRNFGIKTRIFSIDLPDNVNHVEHPGVKRGKFVINLKNVRLLQGDGLDTSLAIYEKEKNDAPDKLKSPLFFIDGDHGFDSVIRELKGIISSVPDANILVHDTFFQSSASGYNTGPYRAVQDIMPLLSDYKIYQQNLGLPGMTLLYKKRGMVF